MIDYDKPVLNKEGKPLKLLEVADHHCIRCIKKTRALQKVGGYEIHGMGKRFPYGAETYETYSVWSDEKTFKNEIKMHVDSGVDLIVWDNEPDHPVKWIREVVGDKIPIVADLHDLDSIRREMIPLPEREMFNNADALIYVSLPIQKITNKLQSVDKPNIVLYSYCNNDLVDYDIDKVNERHGIVYEGGANSPDDTQLTTMYKYRSLYEIMKKLVEMGNELHMYCGNFDAFTSYQHIGIKLYPPTAYDEMMANLINFKYGALIFNNTEDTEKQVKYTLTNKMQEYLQAGLPSLACWCEESMRVVKRHGIGFTFEDIEEIENTSKLETKYLEVMDNIHTKRKELVMENFIVTLENLYAQLLGVEQKGIPDNIKAIHDFEFGN